MATQKSKALLVMAMLAVFAAAAVSAAAECPVPRVCRCKPGAVANTRYDSAGCPRSVLLSFVSLFFAGLSTFVVSCWSLNSFSTLCVGSPFIFRNCVNACTQDGKQGKH